MSRTLSLIHAGWTTARSLARTGRRTDAIAHAERLLARPDLPAAVAADTRRLIAELLIESERFKAAQRYLRAARELQPDHPRTHYLAGLALERDPAGDDRRAALRFRKASQLEPGNPSYRAAFGRAAARCGRLKTGLRQLLGAAEMVTADAGVIRFVVEGLIEVGRPGTARRVLTKARFRFPKQGDLARLAERVLFETARVRQQITRKVQDARIATDGDLVLLPFIRVVGTDEGTKAAGTIRRDVVSLPRPHLARLRAGKADR